MPLEEITFGRATLLAVARGSGGGRSQLLNGHLDTVCVGDGASVRAAREDGRLYGCGAYDITASTFAVERLG